MMHDGLLSRPKHGIIWLIHAQCLPAGGLAAGAGLEAGLVGGGSEGGLATVFAAGCGAASGQQKREEKL
jgi:hypothetical protein